MPPLEAIVSGRSLSAGKSVPCDNNNRKKNNKKQEPKQNLSITVYRIFTGKILEFFGDGK